MTAAPSLAAALAAAPVVLDGGLSTELEARGHDVAGALWSARLLRDDPGAVVAAHRAFLDAGARVATTASYQATFEGFARGGVDRAGAARLMTRSVQLARQAVSECGLDGGQDGGLEGGQDRAWVAASVGPYGALLADGSEYTGAYADSRRGAGEYLDVAALRAFHRPRLEVLAAAGADLLALETVPCLAEAQALMEEVAALAVPAWLALTTVTGPDGVVRTRLGEPAEVAFAQARETDAVIAVGVNCIDPDGVNAAVELAARVGGKPVVVYPNSGETWDAAARTWCGTADLAPDAVLGWARAGARLIGGCCRVGPAQVAAIAALLGTDHTRPGQGAE